MTPSSRLRLVGWWYGDWGDVMTIKEQVFIWGKRYIDWRLRSGRGATYTAELTSFLDNATRAGAVTILLKTYCNFVLPWYTFILLYLIQKLIEYHIGKWDEKHGGLWRYENGYQAERLSPWNDTVLEKLKQIEKNTIK